MSTPTSNPLRALYVTGNAGKFEEAEHVVKQLCPPGNVLLLERVEVDLPELQGNAVDIAIAKTREAKRQLMAANKLESISFIITDDSGLGLSCLNNFPGVYIKAMLHSIGDVGIGKLVDHYTDKTAIATCTLGVLAVGEGNDVETFTGELKGSIIPHPRGNVRHGALSWNTVFVPAGETRTFGEISMQEHATMSHRRHAFASFLASVGRLRPDFSAQSSLDGAHPASTSPRDSSLTSPSLLVSGGSCSSRTLKQKREASDAKEFCDAWQSNVQVANWNTRWFKSSLGGGAGAAAVAPASRDGDGTET